MTPALAYRLADGRLHLQHGPIDLICEAWGSQGAVAAGYARATARFESVLNELVAELPALRREKAALFGSIARKMVRAVAPFQPAFITPMAAVAGAVAETVLNALNGPDISRAYVNNGGDIALHLAPGQQLNCAIAGAGCQITVQSGNRVRGIATSGWRGRSWSLGIADSVSVLAKTAAMADAAATMIANAVDLPGHSGISRKPAIDLQCDSDLGDLLVTTGVEQLSRTDVAAALLRGGRAAQTYRAAGLIEAAALYLQGESQIVGPFAMKELSHA